MKKNIQKMNLYENSWLELFKNSLYSRFNNLKEFLEEDLSKDIEKYIQIYIHKLVPSKSLHFSHLDGFQGILKKDVDEWKLLGVIDIEDHQYTDQRFVLAGFELNFQMKGRILPQIFWDEYQNSTITDPTFEITKDIFKVYYLLVWCFVFRNDKEKFKENISFLRHLIQ